MKTEELPWFCGITVKPNSNFHQLKDIIIFHLYCGVYLIQSNSALVKGGTWGLDPMTYKVPSSLVHGDWTR